METQAFIALGLRATANRAHRGIPYVSHPSTVLYGGWLGAHDNMKVGWEVETSIAAFERLRLVTELGVNVSANASEIGLADEWPKELSARFERKTILDTVVAIPRSDLIAGALRPGGRNFDTESIIEICLKLAEMTRPVALWVPVSVEISEIALHSSASVWARIKAIGLHARDAADDAVWQRRITTLAAVVGIIAPLSTCLGPVDQPKVRSEEVGYIEVGGVAPHIGWETLKYDTEALFKRLRDHNETERVRAIQSSLIDIGIDVGSIDGALGPRTRAGMNQFARQNGFIEWNDTNAEGLSALLALKATAQRMEVRMWYSVQP